MPNIKLNAWYLDDGTIIGKVEELQQVVDILVEEGPARGLVLSTADTVTAPEKPKTTVWSPAAVGGDELLLAIVISVVALGGLVRGHSAAQAAALAAEGPGCGHPALA